MTDLNQNNIEKKLCCPVTQLSHFVEIKAYNLFADYYAKLLKLKDFDHKLIFKIVSDSDDPKFIQILVNLNYDFDANFPPYDNSIKFSIKYGGEKINRYLFESVLKQRKIDDIKEYFYTAIREDRYDIADMISEIYSVSPEQQLSKDCDLNFYQMFIKTNGIDKIKRLFDRHSPSEQIKIDLLAETISFQYNELAEFILNSIDDINKTTSKNAPLIFNSVICENDYMTKKLLEKGANPIAIYEGLSMLMVCSLRGTVASVKNLLNYGADISHKNNEGQTIMDMLSIVKRDNIRIVIQSHEHNLIATSIELANTKEKTRL